MANVIKINGKDIKDVGARDQITELKSAMSLVEESFDVDFAHGHYIALDGSQGNSNSYSATEYIPFTKKCSALLKGAWAGTNSYVYAFFDSNKGYISGTGVGQTDVDDVLYITTTLDNVAFIRFSSRISNGETPTASVYNYQITVGDVDELKKNISYIAETTNIVATVSSGFFTRYGTNGYINSAGVFIAHENYVCYVMESGVNTSVYFDTTSVLTRFAIYNGEPFVKNNLVGYYTSTDNNLPSLSNPVSVLRGCTLVICVNVGNDFSFHFTDDLISEHQISYIDKPVIKIVPISETSFSVAVLDKASGKYIDHRFNKIKYTDTLTYGNSQTKSVVTCDVWNEDYIYDWDGNKIAQGNTNFIQALKITDHTGHVGPGHGCCVSVWNLFFADGKAFDPAALTTTIDCSTFRFMTKENYYLRDTAGSPSSAHSYPSLDNEGNPIIVSTGYIDCEWYENNRIKMRNRLDIVYDTDFQYSQCHAAMCCGYYPFFNNVIYNSPEYVWNEFTVSDGTATVENKGGTETTLPTGTTASILGDQIIMFGDNFRITKRIEQVNPTRWNKTNMLIATLPNVDGRTKAYLMPCVCDQSSAIIATGETRETFSRGDIIDTLVYAELDVSI